MKLTAAIAGLAAALAVAGAAQADPLFDLFQTVCVKTQAQPAAALKVAESQGWVALPPQVAAQLTKAFGADASGDARVDMATHRLAVVGEKEFPLGAGKTKVQICTVGVPAADATDIKAEAAEFAGVAPYAPATDAHTTAYVFTEDGSRHTAIANPNDDKTMASLVTSGRARVVFVQADGPIAFAAYAIPEK